MFTGRKLPITLAFVVLVGLAFGASCKGFFVDPVLTSIAITPPTPQVQEGKTVSLTATGTYDDNKTKNITSSVTWTAVDGTIATVDNSGVVTGVKAGSTTINASKDGKVGSTTVTVTLANLVSIAVNPTTGNIGQGQTQQFNATGTFSNGASHDITSQVTWTSSNQNVATISNASPDWGLASAQPVSQISTANITATSGTIVSPVAVLTVNP